MPPQLDQATIKLLDDTDIGESVVITYWLDAETQTVASGRYAGQMVNSRGERCVGIQGIRDSVWKVQMTRVVKMEVV